MHLNVLKHDGQWGIKNLKFKEVFEPDVG